MPDCYRTHTISEGRRKQRDFSAETEQLEEYEVESTVVASQKIRIFIHQKMFVSVTGLLSEVVWKGGAGGEETNTEYRAIPLYPLLSPLHCSRSFN